MSTFKDTFKNQFKVLSLPYWVSNQHLFKHSDIDDVFRNEREIHPIFYRNGYYFDRLNNMTWIEYEGWAKTYKNKESFMYELTLNYEAGPQIEDYLFNVMKKLRKTKYFKKTLRDDFHYEKARRKIREAGRSSRKSFLAFKKNRVNHE